jgi:outer membrane protein TolC
MHKRFWPWWPVLVVWIGLGIGLPMSIHLPAAAQEQPTADRGSRIENRGLKIEDRGSRIGDGTGIIHNENSTVKSRFSILDPRSSDSAGDPRSSILDPRSSKPLPINLPTALQLANAQAIDIAVASQRIEVAVAQLQRAQTLWLPTIYLGTDYYRHDGQIQETPGNVFGTSRSSFMLGAGPSAVFAISDAIFEPLAARQVLRAREAAFQTASNDTMLAVAQAYFNVQQARGDLAGAEDAVRRSDELTHKVEGLAPEIVPQVEATRVRAELSRRRQTVNQARDRWRIAASELQRILRLDPAALIEPVEPPQLAVTLVSLDAPIDELIPVALMNRPELAAQQALVQATLERLRQERLRPLVPSVALRGSSTPVTGTLAGGLYGGGRNDFMGNFGARSDFDIQVFWEFQNLLGGNRARVKERRADNQLAILELFRIQDQVAADVVQAHDLVRSAAGRMKDAESELRDAVDSATKNFETLGQFKTAPGTKLNLLIIRPLEVVAAIQSLAQAYTDYYGAIGDYNRAQFQLYRALGHPAQLVAGSPNH